MKQLYSLTLLLLLAFAVGEAQTPQPTIAFRSATLQRLATGLKMPTNTLCEGYNHLTLDGRNITVHLTAGEIDHIGQSLFPDEMKTATTTLLLNFLERYALELRMPEANKTAALMLRDDKVTFNFGTLATFSALKGDEAFAYTKQLGQYTCTWSRNDKKVLELSFPADYQLLCGQNKIEVEKQLEADLNRAPVADTTFVQPDTAALAPTAQQQFFIRTGGTYLDNRLNANLYYERVDSATFRLLADASFPAESCANLMLCPATSGHYTLNIEQQLYGYESKQLSVPLGQWLAYCQQTGCQLYFGVESTTDNTVKAIVMAVNTQADYNHLLTFSVPFAVIEQQQGAIEAKLYSFVPMHNVRNIFGKYKKTKQILKKKTK